VALSLDSSLAFRPTPGTSAREGASAPRATDAQAFSQALEHHVAPARTPLTGSQAADALQAAWQGAMGRAPSQNTLSILVGQWAHETGRGVAMLNYNFGGIKGTGPSGASTVYATHEGSGASALQIRDRFRAYDSPEQGASDYLSLLQRRYPDALQAAERGDPVGFVQALKARGYFTGDEAAYAKSVAGLAQRALALGFDEIGSSEAAALGGIPSALEPARVAASTSAPASSVDAHGNMVIPPGAYAGSFADEIGRVELLISALRIGQLGEKAG
jgi:flagellar protein FlgJ